MHAFIYNCKLSVLTIHVKLRLHQNDLFLSKMLTWLCIGLSFLIPGVVFAQLVILEMGKLVLILMSVQEMSVIISVSTLQDRLFVHAEMATT